MKLSFTTLSKELLTKGLNLMYLLLAINISLLPIIPLKGILVNNKNIKTETAQSVFIFKFAVYIFKLVLRFNKQPFIL